MRSQTSKIDKSLAEVRRFYEVGQRSIREMADRIERGKADTAAARLGVYPEKLRKARVFAQAYTPAQLDRLCRNAERHGYALGVSHLVLILSVPVASRDDFVAKAIEGKWSSNKIKVEIAKLFGNRRPAAGRQPRVGTSRDDILYEVGQICEQWQRLYHALGIEEEDPFGLRDLPPKLEEQMSATNAQMKKLKKLIRRAEGADRGQATLGTD